MAYRGSGILLKQKQGNWLSHNAASSYDNCILALDFVFNRFYKRNARPRCRRLKEIVVIHEIPKVYGSKAVNVLVRQYRVHYQIFIDVLRQGQLDKDAMHAGVVIELCNKVKKRNFINIFRKIIAVTPAATLQAVFFLEIDIYF